MALASTVPDDFEIPKDVLEVTGPRPVPIWLNETGGLTVMYHAEAAGRPMYLKRNLLPNSEDLELEAQKLRWLAARHPAPRLFRYVPGDEVEYLITEALPGANAVSPVNIAEANRSIAGIGWGLRRLHELPVADCPWTWSIGDRLELLAAAPAGASSEAIGPPPSIDRLVVCHGDPCAPNTLLREDGRFVGHVDVQRLGAADRWADLAVATMSFEWNYSDYDEAVFWGAYGVEPDQTRIHYYRNLWNAE